ncbi:MAG: HD domain-containing protein [Candidatus Thorarchaeota archaeon]|nr:HD domain-containing protein [Candidatus Thorarchaeota archaeon]
MPSDNSLAQIEFLIEIDKLKKILRQTWLVDNSRQENSAEHTWHAALSALVFSEYANDPDLDLLHVVKMLLIHDLVEIDAGDTFLYSDHLESEKYEAEQKAAKRIFGLLPPEQRESLLEIWEEFESMSTPEAKFAKAVDSLQPILMAYGNEGASWKKHNLHKADVLEKKKKIRLGSEHLWKLTQELLDEASERGYFGD